MYVPPPPLSLKRWEALAVPGHSDDYSLTVRLLLLCPDHFLSDVPLCLMERGVHGSLT